MLDVRQLNFRYDGLMLRSARREYRLNPSERTLNTDHTIDQIKLSLSQKMRVHHPMVESFE